MARRPKTQERLLTLGQSKSLHELLLSCESRCVADCCGLDAFDLSAHRIQEWLKGHPFQKQAVRDQLEQLLLGIEAGSEAMVGSRDLNTAWSKAGALRFFGDLLKTVKEAT